MSEQEMIDVAKAPTVAYNKKDWNEIRATMAPGFVYDEVATQRRGEGADQAIELWQGWAKAFPDSTGTFGNAFVGGGKVVLEITWTGKNTGPLQIPGGEIPATGKSIEIRSCQVVEIKNGKPQVMRHYFDMMTLMQQLGLAE